MKQSGTDKPKRKPLSGRKLRLGPAVLVTAAFIGPGTVLTASRAGAQYGYSLLWAILFSVATAIVLQEMAARLGIVSQNGLAEAIRSAFSKPLVKWSAIFLVLGAILFGNCAYQTGNILGAATGLEVLTGISQTIWAISIAVIAIAVIVLGRFSVLQWLLTILVGLMGILFVFSAILCGPEFVSIASGFKPAIPKGSEWVIIGLIGTTVVPYNLFLHASAAAARYSDHTNGNEGTDEHRSWAIRHSFVDTVVSIVVGGIITAALMITAAVTFQDSELGGLKDIAEQLRPGLGIWAEKIFGVGLFAAGLTSSITAPVAAAYATAGCFGWETKLLDPRLRSVAIGVVAIGLLFAVLYGSSPAETILVAQIANGLLLPVVAIFLIYVLNQSDLIGRYKNGLISNLLGSFVVLTSVLIAASQFRSVWNKISSMW